MRGDFLFVIGDGWHSTTTTNPTVNFCHIPDYPSTDQFDDSVHVTDRVPLYTQLGSQVVLGGKFSHFANLPHIVCHRFFAIEMLSKRHGNH